jgi:hypothetical protein
MDYFLTATDTADRRHRPLPVVAAAAAATTTLSHPAACLRLLMKN